MELELSMHNMTKDQEDILTQSFIPYFFKKKNNSVLSELKQLLKNTEIRFPSKKMKQPQKAT